MSSAKSWIVFGGPYGNLQATLALLEEARRLAIPPERTICTGDLVAYCANPVETIDLVREAGLPVVMGNCDEQLGQSAGDCGCGFPSGSTCERLSAAWYAWADRHVRPDQRAWLATLPRRLDMRIGGRTLAVIHGSLSRINEYIFASTQMAIKVRELDLAGVDGIIGGHSGIPFSQVIDGRLWHNSGAIGMPANDGTQRIWYSLISEVEDGLEIEHRALGYDYEAAADAMRRAALPAEYREALSSGLWPSCDVLPYREIRERGVRLEAGSFLWNGDPAHRPVRRRGKAPSVEQPWPLAGRDTVRRLDPAKFQDRRLTAKGEERASVPLRHLETLWFNTGTLCNIECRNCYIESSPKNDRLAYISLADVRAYLDEIEREGLGTREIGFTGGEPFMNPDMLAILEECLGRGFRVLLLTNAMRPMQRHKKRLAEIGKRFGNLLSVRVSLDHFSPERHEEERGLGTFAPTLDGLVWLARNSFDLSVAGRTMWGEDERAERAGYQRLFDAQGITVDAFDPARLVLFPEMDDEVDVPEITTACWDILHKSPADVMCSGSRMVVRRKGAEGPTVLPCTLIAYDAAFEMGATLVEASAPVALNHPHCARFCVLGGASCSPGGKDAEHVKAAAE